ncbi:MAG: hypothetical protein F4Z55_17865 [Boseongicola sp. SB0667_bin_21]|nr:hypothetical protein [Boseongicola sp. SB0667_bin_21]
MKIARLDLPLRRRNAEDPRQCLQRRCLAGPFPPIIAVTPESGEKVSGSGPKQRKFLTVSVSIFILCPR